MCVLGSFVYMFSAFAYQNGAFSFQYWLHVSDAGNSIVFILLFAYGIHFVISGATIYAFKREAKRKAKIASGTASVTSSTSESTTSMTSSRSDSASDSAPVRSKGTVSDESGL